MEETMLTILMVIVTALLFCLCYIVPIMIAIIGAVMIKQKSHKTLGSILVVVGLVIEIISIAVQVYSFG